LPRQKRVIASSQEVRCNAALPIKVQRKGQYAVFTLGRAPRCQRHNRLDASLRIGRGKDSPSTEAVPNQTNPLVVDINVEPETVACQHLIHKKPHIRHATPDHPVDDKRPMFCSLRPARELRSDQFGMVECADHIAVTCDMRPEERRLSASSSASV